MGYSDRRFYSAQMVVRRFLPSAMRTSDNSDWHVHVWMLSLHDLFGRSLRRSPSNVLLFHIVWFSAAYQCDSLRRLTIDGLSKAVNILEIDWVVIERMRSQHRYVKAISGGLGAASETVSCQDMKNLITYHGVNFEVASFSSCREIFLCQ